MIRSRAKQEKREKEALVFNKTVLPWALLGLLAAGNATASTWVESINGDLANNWLSPSALTLTAGNNLVQA